MAPDDWKAWLEFTLLVAVTLLALGRWVFGREQSDQNHTLEIGRLRERSHDLAAQLHQMSLQVTALEERLAAVRERVISLEGRPRPSRQPNGR